MVTEHAGRGREAGWTAALADVAEGRADVLAVPALERLGHARQVTTRLAEASAAGGTVVGPDVAVAIAGTLVLKGGR